MQKALIAGTLALLLATPASAQEGEDWDFGQDAGRDLTIAAVTFDNFGVAVRCLDETLSVVVSGLPTREGVQTFSYQMGDETDDDTLWVSRGVGQSAFALWPAHVARDLSKGGRFALGVPDGERIRRIAVDLPASPSAIGRVFQACDRQLDDDTSNAPDRENLAGLQWRDRPQPSFPARTASETGIAALTCDVDGGGALRRCRVESEFPEGGGFGRAAVLGAHRTGRVQIKDGETGSTEGRRVAFYVRYGLGLDLPPVPSRLPPRG